MTAYTIIIVDDEPELAASLTSLLSSTFPDVTFVALTDPKQALALIQDGLVSMVFTDLRMPGMDGMELLAQIKAADPAVSVVVMTAFGSIEMAVSAVKHGAFDFICKPFDQDAVSRIVPIGLERSDLIRENMILKRRISDRVKFANFVGNSEPMRKFYGQIQAVARTDYTVLVRGESGTGKELTSKAIHALSRRKDASQVTINCPAIPEHLLESELFGHKKGAFTGADSTHPGLFEEADGGTICLDEIGDIPLSVQAKLLRVLQESEIRPVGSNKTRKVNVRIVAATNQNLEQKIAEGSFRSDLFYRLNVVTIWTPTLHEISEDIPLLANHFAQMACVEQNLPAKKFSGEALAALINRSWPGNVRELQNVIRRAVLFCSEDIIEPECLDVFERSAPEASCVLAGYGDGEDLPSYKLAKDTVVGEFSRNYLTVLLGATHGNVSRAATRAGVTRVALQKIMQRYDVVADDFRNRVK